MLAATENVCYRFIYLRHFIARYAVTGRRVTVMNIATFGVKYGEREEDNTQVINTLVVARAHEWSVIRHLVESCHQRRETLV